MAEKAKYKTKQRDLLLSYLRTVPGVHVTAGDVCRHFEKDGISIGQATVYRQLEMLVDEGEVSKYNIDSTSPACFEYIDRTAHCGETACYHCKCEVCGTLFHVHCTAVTELGEHLLVHHGFTLDPRRTVFYGLCEKCRGGRDAAAGTKEAGCHAPHADGPQEVRTS